MNKIMHILPILILGYLGYLGYLHISKPVKSTDLQMISMKVPEFALKEALLSGAKSDRILTEKDLPREVMMINVFASWCTACAREHHQLMILSKKYDLAIFGIAHNDTEKALIKSFKHRGNPYQRVAITPTIYDFSAWGKVSTPESFLIDANGIIRYRHKGAILKDDLENIILPVLKEISQ